MGRIPHPPCQLCAFVVQLMKDTIWDITGLAQMLLKVLLSNNWNLGQLLPLLPKTLSPSPTHQTTDQAVNILGEEHHQELKSLHFGTTIIFLIPDVLYFNPRMVFVPNFTVFVCWVSLCMCKVFIFFDQPPKILRKNTFYMWTMYVFYAVLEACF